MLEAVKKLFDRKQKPPYQAGTNLLLLLILSVVIGSGVSYATLGFMKAFDRVVNWVYFDWNDSPSGRYTHKVDARNKLSLDFRGNNSHNLNSLQQTQWPTAGDCILITTRDGVRQAPVTGQWDFENDLVRVEIEGQPIELKFDGKHLFPIAAAAMERGGHISIGLGDYPYRELEYPTNAGLVTRICQLARDMGREVATPAEARELLGIGE